MPNNRLTKGQILEGVSGYTRAWFSGHNEVTRAQDGAIIVRYIRRDIVFLSADRRQFWIDCGGDPGAVMLGHIDQALRLHVGGWQGAARPMVARIGLHPVVFLGDRVTKFNRTVTGVWTAEGWQLTAS